MRFNYSDAASGWAWWALAHPEFGVSVNPIPSRGADYAHCITACPPGFANLAASLVCVALLEFKILPQLAKSSVRSIYIVVLA